MIMISLEVNGLKYQNFTNVSCSRSYTSVPSKFSFTATTTANDPTTFPFVTGEIVRVLIGDECFTAGFVQTISVSHSTSTHNVSIQGQSFCVDLCESKMDETFVIATPCTFLSAINTILTLSQLPITAKIADGITVPDFEGEDAIEGEIGDSPWSLICKLAIKKSLLVTEDGDGNIVFNRGAGRQSNHRFVKKVNGSLNNVLSSTVSYSVANRFRTYTMKTQKDYKKLDEYGADDVVNIEDLGFNATATDRSVRGSRFLCTISESSSTPQELSKRANWQANVKRTQSFGLKLRTVTCLDYEGQIIEPGDLVFVDDDYSNISGELIVSDVSISFSSSGSKTDFTLMDADAFTLQAEGQTFEQSGQKQGDQYDGAQVDKVLTDVDAAVAKTEADKAKAVKEQGATVEESNE